MHIAVIKICVQWWAIIKMSFRVNKSGYFQSLLQQLEIISKTYHVNFFSLRHL